jgi:hypothetical protein
MVVTNTWFKQEKRRIYTWKQPGDLARYQIDYIMVKERYRNSVKSSHAYPGADADTDHNLVIMKSQLQLKFIKKKGVRHRWNRDKLKDTNQNFTEKLEQNVLQQNPGNPPDAWKQLKNQVLETAKETIGYRNDVTAKKPWVTEEMLLKMKERRKWKHQSTEEARSKYRSLNNELKRETEKAREAWWNEKCCQLEELQRRGRQDKVYDQVRKLSRVQNNRGPTAIQDKSGKLLTELKEIMNRWKEYIEQLYNKDGKPTDMHIGSNDFPDEEGPNLLREEILQAINEMKSNKTEGVDTIPAEMLKKFGTKATEILIRLCQDIYTTGIWPEDFLQSVMIPLQKKPNATKCEDYRTISLISHASKIMVKVLQKRIEAKVETTQFLTDDQFGFRRGRGTRDAIATLRTLAERSLEFGQSVYICFVDYEKAFDRVDWKKLMSILRKLGVDYRDRRLIGNLYMGQSFKVRIDGEDSTPGIIGRGTRQGCPLSPLLFNIYIQALLNEALEDNTDGIKVGGHLVQAIRFADDQAMVANTVKALQRLMDALDKTSEEFGMRINIKKTKVMVISKGKTQKVAVYLHNEKLEQVTEFCYLGSMITADARCQKEIKRRIAMAKEAFNKRGELLRGSLSVEMKKRMVKALIWSVALYGSETWTMTAEEVRRLEAFEMWIWRRMCKISWMDHITNEEVLRRVGEKRSLMQTIRMRQKNWIGHVLRGNSLLRTVLEGRLQGKHQRGRPRKKMLDWMLKEGNAITSYSGLKREAQDRDLWRHHQQDLPPAEN